MLINCLILGPTYADFYMSHLENTLLGQNKVSNPIVYVRYVDDILAIFNSNNHVHWFVRRLQNNSVLKFTTEHMTGNKFHFLDVNLTVQSNGCITTSVFIKPTDTGTYSNFQSHVPLTYKKSIVKTLVNRALKYSSTWELLNIELDRLKQVFANNGFPQALTEQIIANSLNNFNVKETTDTSTITFYIELDNLSTFNSDHKLLQRTIKKHVKPVDENSSITLRPFYKPRKLSSLFSTRSIKPVAERSNVVYKFTCTEARCNATYIGYTTNTLSTRSKQHRYNPSSIYKHYTLDHNMIPPRDANWIGNFSLLHSYFNNIDLRLAEAIVIKKNNPYINVKYNEMYQLLKLY